MAKWTVGIIGTLLLLAVAWNWGLSDLVRSVLASGHGADLLMGGLCLAWLLIILKVPWDLYFHASAVAFEQERSVESHIALPAGRQAYVQKLRRWLAFLAVGAHIVSAILITVVAHAQKLPLGYWFAVFYLVATGFRPLLAGYAYLSRKLVTLGEESRYPREDIAELRGRVLQLEADAERTSERLTTVQEELANETEARNVAVAGAKAQAEATGRELRDRQTLLAREFETTTNRLTDNQDVIRGVQAIVRLISQSTNPA